MGGVSKKTARGYCYLALAALILIAAAALPPWEGLSFQGRMAIALMGAGVVLWVTDVLPACITALVLMALMPLFGVCSFNEAWANSINSNVFFLIGTFSFTIALSSTTVPLRVVGAILRWSGNDPKKLILGFMCGTAVFSTVMTDIAACGVFMALCIFILEANGAEKGRSRLGKALMIAVPWGSAIGGAATLCGCGLNIMVVGVLEESFGITVSFLTWLICALPMTLMVLPLSWVLLVKVFKPEAITAEAYEATQRRCSGLPPITRREWWACAVILVTLALWILSTWFPFLNTAAVVMISMALFFIPGNQVMTFDDLVKGVNWGIILLIMGVTSLAAALASTGAGSWIVNVVLADAVHGLSPMGVLAIGALLGCVLHNIIPVGPAVCGILVVPFATLALSSGASMTAMAVMLGWECGVALIIPLDCVPLVSYSYGYYRFWDMMKVGWVPSLLMIVYAATALPAICAALGVA